MKCDLVQLTFYERFGKLIEKNHFYNENIKKFTFPIERKYAVDIQYFIRSRLLFTPLSSCIPLIYNYVVSTSPVRRTCSVVETF